MDLQNFSGILVLLANAAVIASILILASQVRLERQAAIQASAQASVHALNSIYMDIATNADLAHIYRRGRANPESLSEGESARFFYVCVAWFCHHEQAFLQCQSKLMPKSYFDAWDTALRVDMRDNGFQRFWSEERKYFDEAFRRYIDKLIADESRNI